MKVYIDDLELDVIITKKISNKHTYLRVKDDGKIYVNSNLFVSKKEIEKLIYKNEEFIRKSLLRIKAKKSKNDKFFYLGKEYKINYWDKKKIELDGNAVYLSKESNIDQWLKKEAKLIFRERLDLRLKIFSKRIVNPDLFIRKMTSRWGVCNIRAKKITLNLELIKKDIFYIDYVIVHELAHFVHPNHSKEFWNLVAENFKDYKIARKNLNY